MYISLVNRFLDDTAFILESRCGLLLQLIGSDVQFAEHPKMAQLRETLKPVMAVKDGVAHIPVQGTLAFNPDPMEIAFGGVEDSRHVLQMVNDAADDPKVKGALLHVDSPGGFMTGGFDIADGVEAMNKIKPVVAHIGGTGASLAYMIASQAGLVISSRSARVGALGAFNVHIDRTRMAENAGLKVEVFKNKEGKFKAMGTAGTSLTEDQRVYLQSQAQYAFDEFKSAILSARPGVKAEAMQGQVFSGKEAKTYGLVDRLGDSAFALSVLKSKIKN